MADVPIGMVLALAVLAVCSRCSAQQQWLTPDNYIADGDSCRAAGANYGYTAAKLACNYARSRCSSNGNIVGSSYQQGIGAVSLPQCSDMWVTLCLPLVAVLPPPPGQQE